MAAISTMLLAGGLALAGAGAAINYSASKQQTAAINAQTQAQITAQEKSEKLRQQQMNLDASRRKREIIRASVAARQAALAQTTGQGVVGGSSLAGAYGSIAGRTGVNTLGVSQNQEIGNNMFAVHQEQLSAYRSAATQMASAGGLAALGAGLGSLGGAVLNNAGTIGKVGTYLSGSAFSAFAGGGTPSGYGK